MSNKKVFMSVTATAVIASAFIGAESADASTHTVKSGDTLWHISQQHGASVAQLKSWNGLTSEIIFPNQQLKVSGSSSSSNNSGSSSSSSSSSNASSSGSASTYTVKSGDTLSKIASKYGVSVSNLQKWNNISGHLIYPGQVFNVSSSGASNSSSSNSGSGSGSGSSSNSSSSSSGSYTVKSGDTLSQIASAHGISLNNLMSWNNLSTTLIYPGNKLVVSKSGSSSSSSGSSSSSSGSSSNSSGNSSSTTSYTVKSGDSLSKIAAAHGVSVNNLMSWNNLSSTTIYIGDKLTIGGKAASGSNGSGGSGGSSSSNQSASGLIDIAKSVIGTPYVWGGQTKAGFDCSGFIHWAFNEAGQKMSRTSTDGYYNRSYIVDNPQVGDLVFFEGTYRSGISHMGIYLGNNQFIHAGSSTGVTIASVDNSYWSKHFHSFKRFY